VGQEEKGEKQEEQEEQEEAMQPGIQDVLARGTVRVHKM